MANAIDVANFFVSLAIEGAGEMTNLRVNKLLYFAQGWSLARRGRTMFDEEMQAWDYGPVVPSVYKAFSPCGKGMIADVSGDYSPDVFSSEELELLLDVVNEYSRYSTSYLVEMTHKKDTPWNKVYRPGMRSTLIPVESLRSYFSELPALKTFAVSPSADDDAAGYRGEDGILVLPEDWDDDE